MGTVDTGGGEGDRAEEERSPSGPDSGQEGEGEGSKDTFREEVADGYSAGKAVGAVGDGSEGEAGDGAGEEGEGADEKPGG